MPHLYDESPTNGPLRQGEILKGIREVRFKEIDVPDEITSELISVPIEVHIHPRAIVLSPDCDLHWDYHARQGGDSPGTKLMSHVLLCDLEDEAALREARVPSSKQRRMIKQNRDERYHYFRLSETDSGSAIDEFYIDFKKMFALPTEYIFHESDTRRIGRIAVLRPPWNQHLIDRFTYFLGRVGLPDDV